jgi:putative sigma-54 modulation protein
MDSSSNFKLDLQVVNFTPSDALRDFINQKLANVQKFYSDAIGAEVYLRDENTGINGKSARVKMNVPGNDLFAECTSDSWEAAIAEAFEKVKRQAKDRSSREHRHH